MIAGAGWTAAGAVATLAGMRLPLLLFALIASCAIADAGARRRAAASMPCEASEIRLGEWGEASMDRGVYDAYCRGKRYRCVDRAVGKYGSWQRRRVVTCKPVKTSTTTHR